MTLGRKIKEARKAKELTQPAFAKLLGKSVRMIQKYENNEVAPSMEQLEDIAKVLGVEPAELLPSSKWKVSQEELNEIKAGLAFDNYLKYLGYDVNTDVTKWHEGEVIDEYGNKEQVIDESVTTISKDGKIVVFTEGEVKELEGTIRDVINARIYRKLMESDANAT